MNEKLLRPQFQTLERNEKRALMRALADRYQMTFCSMETFVRWGQRCTTGIFEKNGKEFTFVPGDTVAIGWERFGKKLNRYNRQELEAVIELFEYNCSKEEFLRKITMPIHSVTVPPMLVGRKLEGVGWEQVSLEDDRLEEFYPGCREKFRRIENSLNGLSLGCVKFIKKNGRWENYLIHPLDYPELKESFREQGFSLPTAEEWSYLCGGGCRTLFPWGEGIDHKMNLHYYGDTKKPYDLEQPNFFGLFIGYDPYKQEVVDAEELTVCGGDGGESICGGLGPLMGYLFCSPHCKPMILEDEEISCNFHFCRPVIRVEME